jgi:hypothetical protein
VDGVVAPDTPVKTDAPVEPDGLVRLDAPVESDTSLEPYALWRLMP